jgi:hypothetical protein
VHVPAGDDVEAEPLERVLLLLLVDVDADDPVRPVGAEVDDGRLGQLADLVRGAGPARRQARPSAAWRAAPRRAPNKVDPFSQRFEPSVRSTWRSELQRIVPGSKFAASSSTEVVVSVTSVSSPPMIPAKAIAPSASAMTRSAGSSLRRLPSRLSNSSPARARRTMILPPRSVSKSKACSGFPSASMT